MITIGQVMNTQVAAIGADATVAEAIEFLTQHHIVGAPVVDDEGRLVGDLPELALIDVVFDPDVKDAPVSKYMTVDVQSVGPDVPLSRAAKLFALYSFRRIPVVENGKLVGMLSPCDLMNYALRTGHLLTDPLVELIPSLAPIS